MTLTTKASGMRRDIQIAILIGTLLTALWISLTWRYGFDLADEGYYWYGAQRMLYGDVPIRDFMAYDIGRYAWSAALMRVLGDDGIFGARMGAGLYQIVTVVIGVLLALRALDERTGTLGKVLFATLVTTLLNLWVFPSYKVFDYGTSILIVAMLMLMATSIRPTRWFGAGLILGVAAIMGRNHGVYGGFAALLLFAFLLIKEDRPANLIRPAFALIAGTVVGFSPTFLMALLIDGFTSAFINSLRELIGNGATNLSLPVPWPWTINKARNGWLIWGTDMSKGLAFIAILLVPLASIVALARKPLRQFSRTHALVLCASFAGIAYAHYAYSRADLTHLALSIAPLLLLLLSLSARFAYALFMSIVLIGSSVLALAPETTFLAKPLLNRPVTTVKINGVDLAVFPGVDARIRRSEEVFAAIPGARDSFLAVPDAPALYAINRKKMPIWEIYALWPRDPAFEAAELARLKAAPPKVVFLSDYALDNRPELRYSRTHPLTYWWIMDNYQPLPALEKSSDEAWPTYVRKH